MQMQGLSARAKNNYIHVHIDSYMHTDRHIPCGMCCISIIYIYIYISEVGGLS